MVRQGPIILILLLFSCSGKSQSAENIVATEDNKEVVCFIYHRFGDSRYPTTNVSKKDFENHLAFLSKHNFQVLSFSEALQYLQSNEPVRKTAVITIDDGFKSFFENGFPLLKKYAMPATLFINTETVGGGDYMDWSELESVLQNHIEIGNHTHSHNYFLNEPVGSRYAIFKQEIELSQSIIFKYLKIKPEIFSFPYGEFDVEMKTIVKELGFKAAAAQNSGVLYNGTDMFQCPRFPMSEAYSEASKFAEKTSMRALKLLSVSPVSFEMPQDKRPLLTVSFDPTDLGLNQLQCFVQGGECTLHILEKTDKKVTVTVQSSKPISHRRRTLYTITVRDNAGQWHWYSHLWINPKIKE